MQRGFTATYLLIGFLVLALVAGSAYWLGTVRNQYNPQIQQTTNQTKTQSSSFPTSSSTQADMVPQENTVYLGTYQGVDAIFITNKELGKYYEGEEGVEKFSPYKGSWRFPQGLGQYPSDYKDLQNPKRILVLQSEVLQDNNFLLSDNKKFIYLSIMLETKTANIYPDNVTNHIYRVNLDNLQSEELWTHDMSPNKYKGAGGATTINKISSDNNFFVLSIHDCYACEGTEAGLIIINTQTKAEKYFPKIGNVQFNLQDGSFTYQNLAPTKEPCQYGPGCDSDNTRTVYKPSGQVFTEKLP